MLRISSWMGVLIALSFAFVACSGDEPSSEQTAELPFPAWSFEHWVWEDESTQESAEALVS